MTQAYDVIIVGAGHAGSQAAIALRQQKFAGSIALLSDEQELPYERPPLSKDFLLGEKPFERILFRPASFWPERGIDLMTGCRVKAVDAPAHRVTLVDGREMGYGRLIWATGGSPRMLSCKGAQARNIFPIRRKSDVDAIHARLAQSSAALVIGGGYIGLEAAAALRKLGKAVHLIESLNRVLSRVAGPVLSQFYQDYHRAQGVTLDCNTALDHFEVDDAGNAVAAMLSDGRRIAADLFIVGIGIVPEVAPLVAAGASSGNGVDVDPHCRTSLADVYAIGDCAAHANRYAEGAMIRLESVQNAHDQAKVAALDILGQDNGYDAVPWFWSNQYDLGLQTVGLSSGFDEEIVRGDPASASFSVVYLREGRVIALDCVNRAKDYVQGRKAVMEGSILDKVELANADIPIKEVNRA